MLQWYSVASEIPSLCANSRMVGGCGATRLALL
jgi:hypothetical protein